MPGDITTLLDRWGAGDRSALDELAPLVYPQLRSIAGSFLRQERSGHTLNATGLVNELFLKLLARRSARFESRRHFYSLCASLMRMALIDHARTAQAEKRGGEREFVPLHDEIPWVDAGGAQFLELDAALEELAGIAAQQAEIVELRYFAGCSVEETAEIVGVSKSTVDREVRDARAWLYRKLKPRK